MNTIKINSSAINNTINYEKIDNDGVITNVNIARKGDNLGVNPDARQRRIELISVINALNETKTGDALCVKTNNEYVINVLKAFRTWESQEFKTADTVTGEMKNRPNCDLLWAMSSSAKGKQLYYDMV